MKGGIAGGALKRGVMKLGQFIEIRPGLIKKTQTGELQCYPIVTQIRSMFSEKTPLQYAIPGGLIAIGTTLDPTLCKGDRLVGQVIGAIGSLPDVFANIEIQCFLLRKLIGAKEDDETKTPIKVKPLEKDEVIMVNVGSTSTQAKVSAVKGKTHAKITLVKPCCAELEEMVSLSRSFEGSYRLIGYGVIKHGVALPLLTMTPKNKDFQLE